MLAFEPPHFGFPGDAGRQVASGLSRPRRAAANAVRDFMLGAKLMDGKGELLSFGGQVMKNDAGYDVSRLLAGSLDTISLIVEVSLKGCHCPCERRAYASRWIRRHAVPAGRLGRPALADLGEQLACRRADAAPVRRAGRRGVGGAEARRASSRWHAVLGPPARAGRHVLHLGRRTCQPVAPVAAVNSGAADAARRAMDRMGRRSALVAHRRRCSQRARRRRACPRPRHALRGGDRQAGVFHPMAPALASIHRNLKNEFDPAGIFNPGRMYMELQAMHSTLADFVQGTPEGQKAEAIIAS